MKTSSLLVIKFFRKHYRDLAYVLLFLLLLLVFKKSQELPKTFFLNLRDLPLSEILPAPPEDQQSEHKDLFFLKNALATRTSQQVAKAKLGSVDEVFDFKESLGEDFSSLKLPKTKLLFDKVTKDTKLATIVAKEFFHRKRPFSWHSKTNDKADDGYAYPRGHTTRAFVWGTLLIELLPKKEKEIKLQQREKAWNRVILGRHYPDDIYGGELYGHYLAEEFLKNENFQKEWREVKQEIENSPLSLFMK